MPDYDKPAGTTWFGHSFNSIVASLRVDVAKAAACGPVTLVGHDWGAYIVQRFAQAHPSLVSRLVLLDIGYGVHVPSIKWTLLYQWYLVGAYAVSRVPFLGKYAGLLMLGLFPWKWLGPCPHEYKVPVNPAGVQPHMCYPYAWIWSTLLLDKAATPRFQKNIPTLFVHGKRKRAFFHNDKFLQVLDKTEGCEHHALDCGHWIQTQKPDELLAIMRRWLGL
jgi:pimeloyl-ACP methyl ester carboxylesterase